MLLNIIIILILIRILGRDDAITWVILISVFLMPSITAPIWLFFAILYLIIRRIA